MAKTLIKCPHCKQDILKEVGFVNRAKKEGRRIFCSRKCFGLASRKNLSDCEKKEKKRLYDIEYRKKNFEKVRKAKKDYFARTYDPDKARVKRKERSKWHTAYCRKYYSKPENKAHKKDYDRKRRSKIKFGEYWEAAYLTLLINDELTKEHGKRENAYHWGKTNKCLKRKREANAKTNRT